jgi:hypothetical protein
MPSAQAVIDAPPSKRLRLWLIVVTIVTVLALIAAVPSTLFATYMAAFAADDPTSTPEGVVGLMTAVWIAAAVFCALLVAGMVGSWIAYRRRRNRLSFWLSLLAFGPILLILLAVLALVVVSSVWTASILSTPPTIR